MLHHQSDLIIVPNTASCKIEVWALEHCHSLIRVFILAYDTGSCYVKRVFG
jgi:hypothetical protein